MSVSKFGFKNSFLGFSEDAVSWLLDARGIAGLGTECADIELPWKTKQAVKQLLAAANRYSVVQVTTLYVALLDSRLIKIINSLCSMHCKNEV